jgi:hypothetical protein
MVGNEIRWMAISPKQLFAAVIKKRNLTAGFFKF